MSHPVRVIWLLWCGSLWGALVGCGKPPEAASAKSTSSAWFQEITSDAGLDFVHDPGPTDDFFMPQSVGSGCALFDYDSDGRLDILLLQNAGPQSSHKHQLYHQAADGKFRNVSAGSGLDVPGYGMGVICGDTNNDGHSDVCITEYGGLRLFLGDGAGHFRDVTAASGLRNPRWGISAAWFDYDRDGWLDLFVVNYLDYDPTWKCYAPNGEREYCGPQTFSGTAGVLFHNLGIVDTPDGPSVRFEDVTLQAGISERIGTGMGCQAADFDGDGWPDVLVANDEQANTLWINRHDGTFREEGIPRGIALNRNGSPEANMGIAWGDVDNDGLADVLISHFTSETHTLWRQQPRGFYQDETPQRLAPNFAARRTGFGTGLLDFDCDGDLDLVVVAGHVLRGSNPQQEDLSPHWSPYAERNQLFANIDGTFADISDTSADLCGTPRVGRGLSWGDLDNDGGIDLLVSNIAGPARLYRNVVPRRGHWLTIRALLKDAPRDALGAEVTLSAAGRSWTGLVQTCGSYASSQDPRLHFGLGTVEKIERAEILWPDGSRESFAVTDIDRLLVLKQGTGKLLPEQP